VSSLAWVRKYYRVPARRGGRIHYTGCGKSEYGTITGACGAHLRVRLDGVKHAMPFHPTWEIRYLTDETPKRKKSDGPKTAKI
jgi:hypothetical protein